jgi:hypothetical protein
MAGLNPFSFSLTTMLNGHYRWNASPYQVCNSPELAPTYTHEPAAKTQVAEERHKLNTVVRLFFPCHVMSHQLLQVLHPIFKGQIYADK